MDILSFVLRLSLAMGLGTLVGIERQWRKCAAGLRTNVLVAVGAALFMSLASEIGGRAAERIASYIVSGIGFLGAGVILKDGASVRGLNTAATLWCTAAIGAFCGLGYVAEPAIGCVFIVIVHTLLRPVADRIVKLSPLNSAEREEYDYHFDVLCQDSEENRLRTIFIQFIGNNRELMLQSISSMDSEAPSMVHIDVVILSSTRQDHSMEKVASYLTMEKSVIAVKWELLGMNGF